MRTQRIVASADPTATARTEPKGALAVGKAFSILDAFLGASDTLTLAEVAERAYISRSTCHRLLMTLVNFKYLERAREGGFRLGIRPFQLGARVKAPNAMAALAATEMTRLAERTQISAFLSIRQGMESVCIHRVDRGQIILAPYRVGETLPLHVGAAPLILLAALGDDEVDDYLRRPLEKLTAQTAVSPTSIRGRIAKIRTDGFAIARPDDIAIGLTAVGAPIIGPNGSVLAALSLSGLTAQIAPGQKRLAREVSGTARSIGNLLNGETPGT